MIFTNAKIYYNCFLAENRRLSKRVVAQDATVPAAPPIIALPRKIAPPTIIGATLVSGLEENEISETILYNI